MQDFRRLGVWSKGHTLALATYRATATFPAGERFGLTVQMRRAASSVPINIAEGCGRGSDADFARFLQNAFGSTIELEYQVMLARDLGYVSSADADELTHAATEVKRMLSALLTRLRT